MEIIYKVELTKQAIKDIYKLKAVGLHKKAEKIRNILRENPYDFISKKLSGDLSGKRSIRINLQHRLVYEILEDKKTVKILRMWSHYE